MPALGAWDRIGSLDVASGKTEEFNMEKFTGNVIGLTARDSDVMCDRVTAIFADGVRRPLFRGRLPKGLSIRVDLPPGVVQRVTFDCHPIDGGQGTVDLAADTDTRGNSPPTRS
jgi:hypothetical protein